MNYLKGAERLMKRKNNSVKSMLYFGLIALLCVATASGIGWIFRSWNFPETNIALVYLLSVVLAVRFTKGYIYGLVATVAATCAFNYFFTKPYFTLSVDDPTYFITFAIMTITAVITSALTSKVKQNALRAQEKEAEASALYCLTNHLTEASDMEDIASISVKTISEIMHCQAACLCFDESGAPEQSFIQQKNEKEEVRRNVEDGALLRQRIENLHTSYDIDREFYNWPICGRDAMLGVLRIPIENAEKMSEAQIRLLRSMIESMALAMDRFRSAQERLHSKEEIAQERYRGNLLRAISHDLRTPLAGIMGTSEMLMGMTDRQDARYGLAEGIYKDADWLHSLVENILNLTRLQDGRLVLNKQVEAVEEVIGAALSAIGKRASEYEITVNIPDNLMLVPMDARLIDQVLVNLLDNAVKHTPPEKEISVTVEEDKEKQLAVFTVADRGTGIAVQDLPLVFQMFYTTHAKEPDAQRGVGLGLTICESIVKAHGGTLSAQNRKDGDGAMFIFTLPLEVTENDQQQ